MATNKAPAGSAKRCVLEGVPRVGFYPEQQAHADSRMRCPEDVCFPSCLRACLEYLGDGLGCRQIGTCGAGRKLFCGYAHLMGTTGAAFVLTWEPGWHGGNAAAYLVSDDPAEVFRRGLASVGYGCEVVCRAELRKQGADTEDYLRSRIIESIRDRRRPVIAHGVIGPPEECVITGYDEGGDVLIGWNAFQSFPEFAAGLDFEPSGYFRKRNWFQDTWSLVFIGDKLEPPDGEQAIRDALTFALDVVRTPFRYGDRHNGLAAYDAWAEHLLRDEDFATDDQSVLNQRFDVHDDAVGTVAEARWYASVFLAQAATAGVRLPAPRLYDAASCYAAEHDLMWRVWGLVGGIGRSPEKARRLADPEVRRRIVPVIREARAMDEKAAGHLEAALKST